MPIVSKWHSNQAFSEKLSCDGFTNTIWTLMSRKIGRGQRETDWELLVPLTRAQISVLVWGHGQCWIRAIGGGMSFWSPSQVERLQVIQPIKLERKKKHFPCPCLQYFQIRLTDGVARIFRSYHAMVENRTRIDSEFGKAWPLTIFKFSSFSLHHQHVGSSYP